jgi:hypothetical protein
MSNPTAYGFLNPTPFFLALLQGATIGEAYLFSVPYWDWTVSLFGDPLAYCFFPNDNIEEEGVINQHEAWLRMSKHLSRVVAQFYKKGKEIYDLLEMVLNSSIEDEDFEIVALPSVNDLYKLCNASALDSQLKNVVENLLYFPQKKYSTVSDNIFSPFINTYLSEHSFKISRMLSDVVGLTSKIDEDNFLKEGWWQFEFTLSDYSGAYSFYHFILEVSDNKEFTNILYTKNSYTYVNWTYEKEKDVFYPMPFDGVPTSHVGRRIRYESRFDSLLGINEYLTRGETYYFRVTPYNAETNEQYPARGYSDIIYS